MVERSILLWYFALSTFLAIFALILNLCGKIYPLSKVMQQPNYRKKNCQKIKKNHV